MCCLCAACVLRVCCLQNGALLTPAVDVWGFGMLMFEACTGQRPFSGMRPAAVVTRCAHSVFSALCVNSERSSVTVRLCFRLSVTVCLFVRCMYGLCAGI